jgi:hypothetical protein
VCVYVYTALTVQSEVAKFLFAEHLARRKRRALVSSSMFSCV